MPAPFFDQINSAPLLNTDFTFEFKSWVANLVDSLNEFILTVQNDIAANLGIATSVQVATQAAILAQAATAPDSTIWYCSDHVPPCFVGKQNGVLVQFQTAAFP